MAMLIFSGSAAALNTSHFSTVLLPVPVPVPVCLSVALAEHRAVSPRVEGHATNSWPPLLKTMKLLIQDARLVHSAY